MDPQPQIILNASILTLGLVCLFPCLSDVNIPLLLGLSWLTGWCIVVFSEILLVILGQTVSLSNLIIFPLCSIPFGWVQYGIKNSEYKTIFRKSATLVGVLVLILILFTFLSYFANFQHYSPDSITNEGLSRIFYKFGKFKQNDSEVAYWFLHARLPFYIAIHSIGRISGIQLYYTYASATTIFVAMIMVGTWFHFSTTYKSYLIFPLIISLCMFFVNKMVMFHSFYHLSNLTAMAYYSAGVFCLFLYKDARTTSIFLLGCLFLGVTCIIRKEMFLFSLLPFFFLFYHSRLPLRITLAGFSLYLLGAYLWHVYGVLRTDEIKSLSLAFYPGGTHGGMLITLTMFVMSMLIFLIPWHGIKNAGFQKTSLPIVLIFLLFFFLLLHDSFRQSLFNLVRCMFTEKGNWDYYWYIVFFGFLIARLISSLSKRGWAEVTGGIDSFLPLVIISFLVSRWLLYAVFQGPGDENWNDSGNRMLLHIVPVCSVFVGYCCDRLGSIPIIQEKLFRLP